ncbi:MAG: hypothetical protein RMK40_03175 [Chloroflexota bacterium]|nr:hypothetical protein [Chloroflexota bacterium]
MRTTFFSAKTLAVVLALALTASTVGIYAAAITGSTAQQVGSTGDLQVTGPVSNVQVKWTMAGSGANIGKITQANLSWNTNFTGDIYLEVRGDTNGTSNCAGANLTLATGTTSVSNATSTTFNISPAAEPLQITCTKVNFDPAN